MKLLQKLIALVMAAVMLLTLAGCFASAEPGASAKSDVGTEALVDTPMPQPTDPARIIKSANEWNKGRTYAVGIVKNTDMPDGWSLDGSGVEGFPKTGLKSWGFECEVLYYYNYPRLRETAESYDPNAFYVYFSMGRDTKWLSKSVIEEYVSRCGEPPYTGENIDKEEYLQKYFSEFARTHLETELLYEFRMDWNYRQDIQVGDVVLIAVDPQLSINPNSGVDEKWFRAVVAPFAADHPQPHIAKFVDGKLVLPAELSGAFELSRLYDDTEPQLTGIKDGDSVEDIVAFLRAVEQDMARYEAELAPEPAGEPISSGTKPVDPEVDEPEIVEPEPSEPVVQESNEGLQSAVGGTFGWYSTAYSDRVYYADHSGNIMFIDAGTNARNVLEGAALSGDEILLRDANGDCLLSMSFSMKEGFVINRMELDGSGKREIIRLPGHMLTYLDRDFIQTKGSKLYVMLRNTNDAVYELLEIDVDAETARTLYTFESGQSVIGGYGNSLFLRTDLGRIPDPTKEGAFVQEDSMFTPVFRYRFDAYDIETGEITEIMETVLPTIKCFCGHNFLSLTLEDGKLAAHIYDLAEGRETQTVVDVVPEFLLDEPNISSTKWVIPGEVLDGTHFTFGYCEFETENGELVTDERGQIVVKELHYCIVDAKNGTAVSLDDVYADSAVKVPTDAMVFAETDATIYFESNMGAFMIYAVPRQQLLDGHVTDVTIVQ